MTLCLSVVVQSFAMSVDSMLDVSKSDWAYNAIQQVVSSGLMSGTSLSTFSPSGKVSRSQVTQVLYNLGNDDAYDEYCSFKDVNKDNWFYKSVNWCYIKGIVSGTGNNTFSPNNYVTRQDLCVMFFNYFKQYLKLDTSKYFYDNSIYKYGDCFSISIYARDAMSWAVRVGFMSGNSASTLNPRGFATRRELAQLLVNFNNIVSKFEKLSDEPLCYKELTSKSVPYKGSGTSEDPYVFLCEDGFVLTKDFLTIVLGLNVRANEVDDEFILASPAAIVLEIREGNSTYGKLLSSTAIDGTKLQMSASIGYLMN